MQRDLPLSLTSLHNSWGGGVEETFTLGWGRSLLTLPSYFPNGPALFLSQQMVQMSREIAIEKREQDATSKYKVGVSWNLV